MAPFGLTPASNHYRAGQTTDIRLLVNDERKGVPEALAIRGALSWRRLVDDMKLEVDAPPVLQIGAEPAEVSAPL